MAAKPKHECVYADTVGVDAPQITDESGTDRCGFCHAEWDPKPTRSTGGK
jgi:hypothetical protein